MIETTIGKYRVLERIGRGGMGTVYRAVDESLDRPVALKVMNGGVRDSDLEKRFRSEAITVASLNHQGIARMYELFSHDDQWVMAMEYVRGETLERTVERLGALPVARATDFCEQALDALGHAHAAGVVHRDLKPANLMIAESGHVKVMDFGIALLAGTERLTGVGLMMGTPAFMAPEQVLARGIDGRADLYAMGVVYYYLITARLPYRGDTSISMARSHVESQPDSVESVRQGVPDWVQLIIDRAMAKDPNNRFQTASEMADALRNGRAGQLTSLTPPAAVAADPHRSLPTLPIPRPAITPGGSKRPLILLAAAVVGAIAIGTWAYGSLGSNGSADGTGSQAQTGSGSTGSTGSPAPAVGDTAARGGAATNGGPILSAGSAATAVGVGDGRGETAGRVGSGANAAAKSGAARPESASNASPFLTYPNVRWYSITGRKVTDREVKMNLVSGQGQVTITPKNDGAALASMFFKDVVSATYAHADEPAFDDSLLAPPRGVVRGKRHYLILQSKTQYLLVSLDENRWADVLKELAARAPFPLDRRLPPPN